MSTERHVASGDRTSVPSRRGFLKALPGLGLAVGCSRRPRAFGGGLIGADAELGHRIRDRKFVRATREVRTRVVVVGAGIAGLSAAHRLAKRGMRDFVVLELEREPGGNSRSGRNLVAAYPWGAHYVPVPGSSAFEVSELFRDLGVIERLDAHGLPVFREEYLCHDPMERLFLHGRWQEGIVPHHGIGSSERSEIERFLGTMDRLKLANGSDGLPLFAIPVDRSSRDPEWRRLDEITMAAWLDLEGYRGHAIRWYANYSCRDDFGAGIDRVSAWAGLHYFAARSGVAANAPSHAVVTWPEGNGWFVDRLRAEVGENLRTRAAVWGVERGDQGVRVEVWDAASESGHAYVAEGVILAVPNHVATRLEHRSTAIPTGPVSYPWMVANLTLERLPGGRGAPPAWDNVIYDSPGLGYVVATHQHLDPFPKETVLTYYLPLDDSDPVTARALAYRRTYSEWCDRILSDLSSVHPELRSILRNLDVMVWGHGMVTPVPGFLWGASRLAMLRSEGPVIRAHSDLSGMSLFEEACTRGIQAADAMLARLEGQA